MYSVTDEYKAAIAKPVRTCAMAGYIRLRDGTALELSDDNIRQGSLSVTRRLNRRGEFNVGGVYASELSLGLQNFEGVTSDLAEAVVVPYYRLYTTSEQYESVPLGVFYVDGSTIKRRGETVSFKACDAMLHFDKTITEALSGTFYYLAQKACSAAGVQMLTSKEDFEALPNGTLSVSSVNIARVQTYRDLLMFLGSATASYCRIDRAGGLSFVPLTADRESGETPIIVNRELDGGIRFDTEFSDDNVFIAQLTMRRNGLLLSSTTKYSVVGDISVLAQLELPENPLLADVADSAMPDALNNILSPLTKCELRSSKTEFNGDPALDVGDYVQVSGGYVDTKREYFKMFIGSQVWRYRGRHTLKCAIPSSVSPSSLYDTATVEETASDEPQRTQPKSQEQKEIDALKAGLSSGGGSGAIGGTLEKYEYISDLSAKCNGITYTAEKDADTGLISKITDDKGGELVPDAVGAITDVSFHNAVLFAVALARGLKRNIVAEIPDCFARYNVDDCDVNDTTITLRNQAGVGDYVATKASLSDGGVAIDTSSSGFGSANLSTPQPAEWTCYLVIKGGSGTDRGFYIHKALSEDSWHLVFGTGGGAYWVANLNGSAATYTSNKSKLEKCLLTVSVKEGSTRFFINGELITELSVSMSPLEQTVRLISGRYYGSFYDSGTPQTVYDIALASSAHDDATVAQVSAMLMAKYGIT